MPRFASVIILIMLLASSLGLFPNAQPVKATTTIVPDNYPTIQEAINHANTGDKVFVRSGTYHENVVVNKSLLVVGESKFSTIIDGRLSGYVVTVTAENVTLCGFRVTNSSYSCAGIFLNSTRHSKIADNTVTNSFYGVNFDCASYNSLFDCEIEGSLHSGVAFKFDAGIKSEFENQVYRNNIHNNQIGIYFDGIAYNNTISCNELVNNSIGIDFFFWGDGYNTIIQNNIIATQHCALTFDNGENKWDNGYPLGGNYWSDYAGADTDGDGIGDIPYVIDSVNVDNYPLMRPWKFGDINYDGSVDGLDLIFTANALGSVPSDPKWNPRADLKEDDRINVLDLILVAVNLSKAKAKLTR